MHWEILIPALCFAPFFIGLLIRSYRTVRCADCGYRMRRKPVAGVYVCPECGCKMDMLAYKVSPGAPARTPVREIVIIAGSLILGAAMLFGIYAMLF